MIKNVVIFIGTRPEAIKMAPVIRSLAQNPSFNPVVISTGQHREMLDQVIKIFEISVNYELEVMEPDQSLASLSAVLMKKIDEVLINVRPDFAFVQGDTATVLIASLACFYRKIPVGHVEAGLRTNNIYSPFPKEANRRLASPLMALHFCPTSVSKENLLRENTDESKIYITGNTVIDALYYEIERQKDITVGQEIENRLQALLGGRWKENPYLLITGHRRENFGKGFLQICEALEQLAARYRKFNFVYPVHLNPNVIKPVYSILSKHPNILLLEPVDYSSFIMLMKNCYLVLTDSGGVQEEAPSLGKPVLVMRDTTERPEGIDAGTVKLVGAETQTIVENVAHLLENESAYMFMSRAHNPYGNGHAAERIVKIVLEFLS